MVKEFVWEELINTLMSTMKPYIWFFDIIMIQQEMSTYEIETVFNVFTKRIGIHNNSQLSRAHMSGLETKGIQVPLETQAQTAKSILVWNMFFASRMFVLQKLSSKFYHSVGKIGFLFLWMQAVRDTNYYVLKVGIWKVQQAQQISVVWTIVQRTAMNHSTSAK